MFILFLESEVAIYIGIVTILGTICFWYTHSKIRGYFYILAEFELCTENCRCLIFCDVPIIV